MGYGSFSQLVETSDPKLIFFPSVCVHLCYSACLHHITIIEQYIILIFFVLFAVLSPYWIQVFIVMEAALDMSLDDMIKNRSGRGRGRGRGQRVGRGRGDGQRSGRGDGQRLGRGLGRGRGAGTFRGRGVPSQRPLGVNTRSSSYAIAKASTKPSLFFCIPSRTQITIHTWQEVAMNLINGTAQASGLSSDHIFHTYELWSFKEDPRGFSIWKCPENCPLAAENFVARYLLVCSG